MHHYGITLLGLILLSVSLGAGVLLLLQIGEERADLRLARSLVYGTSLIVLVAENCSRLGLPTTPVSWTLVGLAIVSALIAYLRLQPCAADTRLNFARLAGVAVLCPLLFALPLIEISPEALSGSSNPDSFNQFANAEHLRQQGFSEPIGSATTQPWLVPVALYKRNHSRIGASLLVAVAAELGGSDAQPAFLPVQSFSLLLLCCAVYATLRTHFGFTPGAAQLGSLIATSHGLIAHLYFNAGLPFLLAYPLYCYALGCIAALLSGALQGIASLLPPALVLAAGVAIYPEFLPFFVLILVAAFLILRPTAPGLAAARIGIWGLLTIVANPLLSATLPTYILAQSAHPVGIEYLRTAWADLILVPLGLVPFDAANSIYFHHFGDRGTAVAAAVALVGLVAFLIMAWRSRRHLPPFLLVAGGLLVLFAILFMLLRTKEYAGIRLATSAVFPIAGLAAAVFSAPGIPGRWRQFFAAAVVLGNLASGMTFALAHTSLLPWQPIYPDQRLDDLRHFEDTKALVRAASNLPPGTILRLEEPDSDAQIRLAYLLRGQPCLVTNPTFYLERERPPTQPLATHLVRTKVGGVPNYDSATPLWQNKRYELLPLVYPRFALHSGFYPSEATPSGARFCWMQSQSKIRCEGIDTLGTSLALVLNPRFPANLIVTSPDGSTVTIPLEPAVQRISLPLPTGDEATLRLNFAEAMPAVPGDPRELYAIVISTELVPPTR